MSDTQSSTARETNWGRWGDDDERGAINLLTPDTVLAATQACKTGKTYTLGLPIQRTGVPNVEYRGIPQRLTMINHADEEMFEPFGGEPGVGINEDMIMMASHTVTHMDALCHIYHDGAIYNGFKHDDMKAYTGAGRCGIEKAGGVVARGVLVDVAAYKGVDWLEAGYVITLEDFTGALEAQGSEIRPGDAVLVRTGWVEWFFANGAEMSLVQPGIGLDVARYLGERDPVVVGADNSAVEAQPFDREKFLGAHVELLVRRGIYLVEHLKLADLSQDGCREFLFMVSPLPVTGATASPVNPVAIG
jgi:kynurenine formamidase